MEPYADICFYFPSLLVEGVEVVIKDVKTDCLESVIHVQLDYVV